MLIADLFEEMSFELNNKKFMFICETCPHMVSEEKRLHIKSSMIEVDTGIVVSEIDIPIVEYMKDNMSTVNKYRQKLIDQYKKTI